MKKIIHPKVYNVEIICNCGNNFNLILTLNIKQFKVEVCNDCHPFYTGKQKIIDVAGRVDKFNRKFKNQNKL